MYFKINVFESDRDFCHRKRIIIGIEVGWVQARFPDSLFTSLAFKDELSY